MARLPRQGPDGALACTFAVTLAVMPWTRTDGTVVVRSDTRTRRRSRAHAARRSRSESQAARAACYSSMLLIMC